MQLGFGHCNTAFEAMGCFYHYCSCQDARPALIEEDIQRGTKKTEMDEMRKQYTEGKGYTVVEMWECEKSKVYKTDVSVNENLSVSYPYQRTLRQGQFLDKIKSGALFSYVQCDIDYAEHLTKQRSDFPPVFKYKSYEDNILDL